MARVGSCWDCLFRVEVERYDSRRDEGVPTTICVRYPEHRELPPLFNGCGEWVEEEKEEVKENAD